MTAIKTAIRIGAKKALPAPVIRALRNCEMYARRLAAWLHVARTVRGRTPKDSWIIWRSIGRAPLEIFRDPTVWREPALIENAEVFVAGMGFFSVRGYSDDLGHLLPQNSRELFAAVGNIARAGDVVIDAGANIGAICILMARHVGEAGHVIAVEMMPDTAKHLRRNLDLNQCKNVVVVERALSDKAAETIPIYIPVGLFGQASIVHENSKNTSRAEATTTTFDEIASGFDKIALVKMDLEGAEAKALDGGASALTKIGAIIFESWQQDGGEAGSKLQSAGFKISPLDGRNFLATREDR